MISLFQSSANSMLSVKHFPPNGNTQLDNVPQSLALALNEILGVHPRYYLQVS